MEIEELFTKNMCTFFSEMGSVHWEQDEAVKQKKMIDLKKDVIPLYLEKLDAIAKENNGYLALGRVCIHDFRK